MTVYISETAAVSLSHVGPARDTPRLFLSLSLRPVPVTRLAEPRRDFHCRDGVRDSRGGGALVASRDGREKWLRSRQLRGPAFRSVWDFRICTQTRPVRLLAAASVT
ncbi:hypothetical protein MTO96_025031 [Rhipicephalus appendiculatus]